MQAFRRLYEEVGLGWVYAVTKYEPVSAHFQSKSKFQLVSFISESCRSAARFLLDGTFAILIFFRWNGIPN